jgi:membrane protein DedA with SNARE-associated domain
MNRILSIIIALFIPIFAFSLESDSINNINQETNKSLIQIVEDWYEENTNYYTITALMAVESSFIPFPSEIVIPPAAYIANKEDSELNIYLVILFGTIGALIGSYINYFLALWLGRPIIYKFADSRLGKLCLLSKEKIQVAEDYFVKHGKASTLIGRLIPAVRQLISIPAGLSRMNFFHFSLFTFIGAGIWNCVLALLGYIAQGQQELINAYSHELSIVILALFALAIIYFVIKTYVKKNKQKHN